MKDSSKKQINCLGHLNWTWQQNSKVPNKLPYLEKKVSLKKYTCGCKQKTYKFQTIKPDPSGCVARCSLTRGPKFDHNCRE